jgi:hypothetical protein
MSRLLMELLSRPRVVRWGDPEPGPTTGLLGGLALGAAVAGWAIALIVAVVWWGPK